MISKKSYVPWRELPSQGHAKICQSRLTRWRSQGFLSCSYVFSSSWAPNELISTTNLVTTSTLRYMKVVVLVLYGAIELNWAKGRNEDLWYCKLFLPAKKHLEIAHKFPKKFLLLPTHGCQAIAIPSGMKAWTDAVKWRTLSFLWLFSTTSTSRPRRLGSPWIQASALFFLYSQHKRNDHCFHFIPFGALLIEKK